MLYNKKFLSKKDDRKKLRKVKKSWIVVSIAFFGVIGGVELNTTKVSADNVSEVTKSTKRTDDQQSKSQNQEDTSGQQSKSEEKTVSEKKQSSDNPEQQKNDLVTLANNDTDSSDSTIYDLGFNDGFNNKEAALTNSDDYTKGNDSGKLKKELVDKVISDQENGIQPNNAADQDYLDVYNEYTKIKKHYNDMVNGVGTGTKGYTNITLSDKTDTDKSAKKVADYENQLKNQMNTSSNVSVVSSPSGQPIVAKDFITSSNSDDYTTNLIIDYLNKKILVKQAISDAEKGRWSGYNTKNNPVIKISDISDINDYYSQAYLGATAAFKKQWVSDKQLNSSITAINFGFSQEYQDGYNDVADNFNKGTIYISNGQQLATALLGDNHTLTDNGYLRYKTKTINLINDIDYTNVSYSELRPQISNLNFLTIDGQDHIMDTHGVSYIFVPNSTNSVLNVKNFYTLSTWNYYGPFIINSKATMYYTDINYFGSQLLSSPSTDVVFSGNINALNVEQYATPFTKLMNTENPNQENLEVSNLTLTENSNYFANTIKNGGGGTVVYMNGNLTLGQNSTMTLLPRGNSGSSGANGTNWGILNNGGNLKLQEGSVLNILPDNNKGSQTASNGIWSNGNIDVNGGEINILANKYGGFNNVQFVSQGKITVRDNGKLNIIAKNIGNRSATNGIFSNSGTFNILDQGSVKISADGSGVVYLYYSNNKINIVSPGSDGVVFDLTSNTNSQSKLSVSDVTAYAVDITTSKNGKAIGPAYSMNWSNGVTNYIDSNSQSQFVNGVNNYLKISGAPSPKFTSPVTIETDSENKKHATGYLYVQNQDPNSENGKVYLQLATGEGTTFSGLNLVNGTESSDNKLDKNKYNLVIQLPKNYQGQMLYYDIILPDNLQSNSTGIRAVSSVSSTNIVKNFSTNTDTINAQPINAVPKSPIDLNSMNETQINTLDNAIIQKALSDAQQDLQNGNSNSKNKGLYTSSSNYRDAYQSFMDGANNFNPKNVNPIVDSYQISNIEDNAKAYVIGYQAGKDIFMANQADANQAIDNAQAEADKAIDA
ncbi:KxYKxGKxW signal peptide domain-containing protein, partial [Fructobacillus sp. M158]|uniref:KxYKxGKxW signal peptide domain-containing protein n=1 Tax=Fructobacillus parabroussonetiae TaxID=2713174 RepID=UPI00200A877E